MLNVIDEFTREALAIEVDHSIDADRVVAVIDRLVLERGGPPTHLRMDNCPELDAYALADWCRFNDTASVFIDAGSQWQNAWIESFNGRLRDELLKSWHFSARHRRGLAPRLQGQQTSHRPRRPRPTMGQKPPTPSRIATGPPNGTPSKALGVSIEGLHHCDAQA